MRDGVGDAFEDAAGVIAQRILDRIMPSIQAAAANLAESAQPTISRVVKQDVMPWVIGGLVVGAVSAALIGAIVAGRTTKRLSTVRRRR